MDRIADGAALQRLIGQVPRRAPGYSISLYAGPSMVDRWCARGDVRAIVRDGALVVLRPDRDFIRLYHVAVGADELRAALGDLPTGRYVVDLIGREPAVAALGAVYAGAGFGDHAMLRRMGRLQIADQPDPDGGAEHAVSEAADEVASMLERLLDPLSEQLPSTDELRSAARDRRLLVVRRGAAIAGMLMYDTQGQAAHLRFWHVDPLFHGVGVGRALMGSFLSACTEVRRIVLWVIADNDRSIAIYRHYRFEADGLFDRIMVLDKDRH